VNPASPNRQPAALSLGLSALGDAATLPDFGFLPRVQQSCHRGGRRRTAGMRRQQRGRHRGKRRDRLQPDRLRRSVDGYTEAQQFVPGSDRFRFKLNGDGTGTVVLGESQTYPAATDPDVGYPADEDLMTVATKTGRYRAGFEYPVHDVIVESKRIRFKIAPNDFYKGWCELQTPVVSVDQAGIYSCGPNGFTQTTPGTCIGNDNKAINCTKAILCTGPFTCQCTATSCTASDNSATIFDGALYDSGTTLQGSFNSATVRMERKP
jgi:hypothetical protein